MTPATRRPESYTLAAWLFACCGLVFLMIGVGAVTRLTESGLSIAEWKPLVGAIPPIGEKAWHRIFALYQQTPEFQKKNSWMGLEDFKQIFFWEWLHRLFGRLIGIAYAAPLFWFWACRKIPQGYKLKLLGVLALGGLQGALGWYMVKSGLVNEPAVSQYRLAAHLMLALIIYGVMLWLAFSLLQEKKPQGSKTLFIHGWLVLAFLVATICWGAFTAGLDGGLIYNDSFPKMGGAWIPPEAYASVFSNPAGSQFAHRWLAMITVAMIAGFWLHGWTKEKLFPALNILAIIVVLQAGLGLLTLFSNVWIVAAVLHQTGAVILLTFLILSLHQLRP